MLEIQDKITSREVRVFVPISKAWMDYDPDSEDDEPCEPFAEMDGLTAVRYLLEYLAREKLMLTGLVITDASQVVRSERSDAAAYVVIADVLPMDEASW